MRTMDDRELLREYAKGGSESAFAELARRHLNWVHSAVWRQVGDAHLAEEVAQSVFVLLARKAGSLGSNVVLSGWLFRTCRFVASRALRAELRRKRREQEAFAMNPSTTDETDAVWQRLVPHLDQAVASLGETDRSAVLLRFYERKTLEDVGRRLGISEEAAKKRVSRAVEKLREFMSRRGVTLGTAALVSLIGINTVKAAPAALMLSVVKASSAACTSAALPELARQTLNAWRWMKVKIAAALAAATAVTVAVVKLQQPSVGLSSSVAAGANRTESALLTARAQTAPTAFRDETQSGLSGDLPRGAVGGLVLGERDAPISDAHVWAGFASGPDSEAHTDGSGRFVLTAIGARKSVTVSASGFSADQQSVNTNDLSKPLVFHLTPVGPLRFRIMDEAGLPINGVEVCLENWWGGHMDTLIFRQPTAEDGRLAWKFAPKGELEFSALKSGYLSSRRHKLVADNEEHVFVLHPALTASGKVTDAESGAPIAGFTLTRGYSQIFPSLGETRPMWELQDRWHGTNGSYKVIFDEENIPQLHVEAEGYEVLEVKPQFTNGPQTVCDFQLYRADTNHTIRGVVLLPGGGPARDVEVALCTFQVGVMLNLASFENQLHANAKINPADYRQKTNERGEFSFAPQSGAHTVVAVSSEGLGKVRCFDFSQPLEIRLQPWARIQGVVQLPNFDPAGSFVGWNAPGTLHSGSDISLSSPVGAVADRNGNFLIDHVPPGDGIVAASATSGTLCLAPVHLGPGQTLQLKLGGTGCPVAGRLVAPDGVQVTSWSNQLFIAEISSQWDAYSLPEGLAGEKLWRWQMEFAESEAGRAKLGNRFHYRLSAQPDGSFFVPDVLPGQYQVVVTLNEGALGSGPSSANPSYMRQIASLWHKFELPETVSHHASRLDLGDLVLDPSR